MKGGMRECGPGRRSADSAGSAAAPAPAFPHLADAARSCLPQGERCQGLLGVWCGPQAGCRAEAGEPMGPSPNFHLRPRCSTHGSQMWEAVASVRSVPAARLGRSPNPREKHSGESGCCWQGAWRWKISDCIYQAPGKMGKIL